MSFYIAGAILVSGVYGANKSSKSADKAGKNAVGASGTALDETRRQFDTVREDSRIARETGNDALLTLGFLLGTRQPPSENRIKNLQQQIADAEAMRERSATAPAGANDSPVWNGSFSNPGGGRSDGGVTAKSADVGAIDANIEKLKAKLAQAKKEMGIAKRYSGGLGDFLKAQPGYQFGMDEGTKAVVNNLSSSGQGQGGKAMKSLMRFGDDYASTKADEHLGRLFTLAGYGPVGVNQSASAGQNVAQAAGNHAQVVGQAGYNTAGAQTGAVNTALNTGMSLWTYNDMMSRMNPQPSSGAPTSMMNMPQGNTPNYTGVA